MKKYLHYKYKEEEPVHEKVESFLVVHNNPSEDKRLEGLLNLERVGDLVGYLVDVLVQVLFVVLVNLLKSLLFDVLVEIGTDLRLGEKYLYGLLVLDDLDPAVRANEELEGLNHKLFTVLYHSFRLGLDFFRERIHSESSLTIETKVFDVFLHRLLKVLEVHVVQFVGDLKQN